MKKHRIIFSIMLAVAVLLCMTVSVSAEQIDPNGAFEIAAAFEEEFCNAAIMQQDFDFTKYTSLDNLVEYISSITIERQEGPGFEGVTDLVVIQELNKYEYVSDSILLEISLKLIYRNGESTIAYPVFIIVGYGEYGLEVKDWHEIDSSYDYRFRGKDYEIGDPNYWMDSPEIESVLEIANAEREKGLAVVQDEVEAAYLKTLASHELEDKENTSVEESKSVASTSATLYSLDKSAIKDWARNNYNKQYPTSGNSNIVSKYYDFHVYGGSSSWDCTNFASHALLAGGAVLYDNGVKRTGWYFTDMSTRSYTWSDVDYFYTFLTTNTTKGPSGEERTYTTSKTPSYDLGDIVQFHSGDTSDYTHTTIITGPKNADSDPTVTGRSAYGSDYYNNDVPVADLLNSKYSGARIIHLLGYYK